MASQDGNGVNVHVTPAGRVVFARADGAAATDPKFRELESAFAGSPAEGLIALATLSQELLLAPPLVFWQSFAKRFLTALCQTPQTTEPAESMASVERPDTAEMERLLASVPPMIGGEYLSVESLEAIWQDLDQWAHIQIQQLKGGLPEFLKRHAPRWTQVGRVCFHLAENKRDTMYPFAFLATYIPGLSGKDRTQHQPLSRALEQYAGKRNQPALVRLLAPIQRAAEQSKFIQELSDSGDIFHPLAWSPEEAYQFLQEVRLYENSGLLVRLPDWWQQRARPRVGLVVGEKRKPTLGTETLLDFKVEMALGEERLTKKEWRELMAGDQGLVLLKGRWVEVDRAKLEAALDHWEHVEQAARDGMLTFNEGMRLLAGAPADLTDETDGVAGEAAEWSFVRSGTWLSQTLAELHESQQDGESVSTVPGLQAKLRPYQQTGVHWLRLMTSLGLGACLADDMGLGKTIQILGMFLLQKQNQKRGSRRPSLVVLPASLLTNWQREIERFAPTLSIELIHSSELDKKRLARIADAPEKELKGVDVVLTTYGTLLRQAWLREAEWQTVVLDEAQAIKNPAPRQTRIVKSLRAQARIALTGTPIENRLSDLWSLFDFLCPGLLGTPKTFKQFVKQLDERDHDRYAPLRNLVRPYLLRRLKTDKSIITDLPDKSEVSAYCGLTKRQAVLYQTAVDEMAAAIEQQDGIQRRGIILAALMRFKQICNHPSQYVGDGQYAATDSGKFARLSELCEEIASRQQKTLVFTQFREMTQPLAAHLATIFGRPGVILHGGTPVRKRQELVEAFQAEEGPPFFVLSLKAGGTGLNLTAAAHVIHFDRWGNPAVETQATDRAFRIGQRQNVLVHKFVCRGTIEERIDQLIAEKQALAEGLLQAGPEKLLTEMSSGELIDLVSLDLTKAKI